MPVDYSKWDNLELSDDSDIEVHPNVDKRSFIRAKQAQIHQERDVRRHQIKTLKYERVINDGLISRIDALLTALKSHKPAANNDNADELVFQALIESAGDAADDQPPPPEEGVHQNVKEQPTYSRMMASLVDQVKKAVDEKGADVTDRLEAYIAEVIEHKEKVEGLQKELHAKLAELEKEDKRHITSDDIHTGFDYSNVQKGQPAQVAPKKEESVQLLNPGTAKRDPLNRTDTGQSSGADADIEDGSDPDVEAEASALGKEFAKIKLDDYRASHQFISEHPSVLAERETDGLLVEAFSAEMEGKQKYARQCVHQALLIQYCRQLGRDGVALFFKRITTQGHQARKLFTDDVATTYGRIRSRVAEIKANREEEEAQGGVEQIQLHAVDPNTKINIFVPPLPTESSAPEEKMSRELFETFPPGLQRALETGSLDEVNKVLGKMSVEEAEEVVGKLSDGGMLSMEEGVIDATTEEGKKQVEEIERTGRMPGVVEELEDEPSGHPAMSAPSNMSSEPPMD
ncbi:Hsp90 co-chaperone Cdc37 [Rhizodiscina lignyota]|uniref:Hsp90 chaperone protein kinase-targeting subunit n=1 Tax=Rhizodiscina lignyota TaxID=1504668 RepID=A0A9P4IN68_9PEZI|nr:Hsp90 co-chaperone Cdc37 [Rhizodiscina lignyota]